MCRSRTMPNRHNISHLHGPVNTGGRRRVGIRQTKTNAIISQPANTHTYESFGRQCTSGRTRSPSDSGRGRAARTRRPDRTCCRTRSAGTCRPASHAADSSCKTDNERAGFVLMCAQFTHTLTHKHTLAASRRRARRRSATPRCGSTAPRRRGTSGRRPDRTRPPLS